MIGKIAHLLFQEMSKIKDSILECIPKKTEKYISFSLGEPPVYRQLERFAIMVGFPCEKSPKGNVRTHQRISRKKGTA